MSSALRNNTVSRIFSSSSTQKKTQIDFFTQTLTVLNLFEQSNRRERSRTFVFCTSKQHSESNFLFFFNTKKDTNRLFHTDTHSLELLSSASRILSSSSTQKKNRNRREKGAEHLSSALRNNTVSRIFSSSSTQKKTQIDFFTQTLTVLLQSLFFFNTKLTEQSNRRQRSRTFVFCTSKQHSESNFLFFFNTKKDTNRLFHTDTHST